MSATPSGAEDPGRGAPPARSAFCEELVTRVADTGPLCAGIDPSPALLAEWGMSDDHRGLERFALRCVEAFAGVVPVVKPQVAFFERHGSAGMRVMERLLVSARDGGLLVIADAKRGDIAETAAAYADAWLDPSSPLAADAVTAVAYLGLGALRPLIEMAGRSGRSVIVVARSSNPEGRALQGARLPSGETVEDALLDEIAGVNAERAGPGSTTAGEAPRKLGPLGAVVGATLDPSSFALERLGGVVLAPGVGAQGAGPDEVGRRLGACRAGTVLPSASRAVLRHGPDVASLASAARALRDRLAESLAGALSAPIGPAEDA